MVTTYSNFSIIKLPKNIAFLDLIFLAFEQKSAMFCREVDESLSAFLKLLSYFVVLIT